jgi:hypothetical protein
MCVPTISDSRRRAHSSRGSGKASTDASQRLLLLAVTSHDPQILYTSCLRDYSDKYCRGYRAAARLMKVLAPCPPPRDLRQGSSVR